MNRRPREPPSSDPSDPNSPDQPRNLARQLFSDSGNQEAGSASAASAASASSNVQPMELDFGDDAPDSNERKGPRDREEKGSDRDSQDRYVRLRPDRFAQNRQLAEMDRKLVELDEQLATMKQIIDWFTKLQFCLRQPRGGEGHVAEQTNLNALMISDQKQQIPPPDPNLFTEQATKQATDPATMAERLRLIKYWLNDCFNYRKFGRQIQTFPTFEGKDIDPIVAENNIPVILVRDINLTVLNKNLDRIPSISIGNNGLLGLPPDKTIVSIRLLIRDKLPDHPIYIMNQEYTVLDPSLTLGEIREQERARMTETDPDTGQSTTTFDGILYLIYTDRPPEQDMALDWRNSNEWKQLRTFVTMKLPGLRSVLSDQYRNLIAAKSDFITRVIGNNTPYCADWIVDQINQVRMSEGQELLTLQDLANDPRLHFVTVRTDGSNDLKRFCYNRLAIEKSILSITPVFEWLIASPDEDGGLNRAGERIVFHIDPGYPLIRRLLKNIFDENAAENYISYQSFYQFIINRDIWDWTLIPSAPLPHFGAVVHTVGATFNGTGGRLFEIVPTDGPLPPLPSFTMKQLSFQQFGYGHGSRCHYDRISPSGSATMPHRLCRRIRFGRDMYPMTGFPMTGTAFKPDGTDEKGATHFNYAWYSMDNTKNVTITTYRTRTYKMFSYEIGVFDTTDSLNLLYVGDDLLIQVFERSNVAIYTLNPDWTYERLELDNDMIDWRAIVFKNISYLFVLGPTNIKLYVKTSRDSNFSFKYKFDHPHEEWTFMSDVNLVNDGPPTLFVAGLVGKGLSGTLLNLLVEGNQVQPIIMYEDEFFINMPNASTDVHPPFGIVTNQGLVEVYNVEVSQSPNSSTEIVIRRPGQDAERNAMCAPQSTVGSATSIKVSGENFYIFHSSKLCYLNLVDEFLRADVGKLPSMKLAVSGQFATLYGDRTIYTWDVYGTEPRSYQESDKDNDELFWSQ